MKKGYYDQIAEQVKKYSKLKDAEAVLYYQQAFTKAAVVSFYPGERNDMCYFHNSYAYE